MVRVRLRTDNPLSPFGGEGTAMRPDQGCVLRSAGVSVDSILLIVRLPVTWLNIRVTFGLSAVRTTADLSTERSCRSSLKTWDCTVCRYAQRADSAECPPFEPRGLPLRLSRGKPLPGGRGSKAYGCASLFHVGHGIISVVKLRYKSPVFAALTHCLGCYCAARHS